MSKNQSYKRIKNEILGKLKAESYTIYYTQGLVSLPPEIGQMKRLKQLEIKYCFSLKTLPIEIGELKQLEVLRLFELTALQIFPEFIGKLTNLKKLEIRGARFLKGTDWSVLAKLKKLEVLNLERSLTFIKKMPKEIFQLTKLKELNIKQNQLDKLPENIARLKKLEQLNFSANLFQKFPKTLSQLPSLRRLALSSKLLETFPETLLKIKNLKELQIVGQALKTEAYYRARFLEKMFKNPKCNQASRVIIFKLLKDKKQISEVETPNLLMLLDCRISILKNEALQELTSRIAKQGIIRGLQKGHKLVFKGKFGGKITRLKARLKEQGISTGIKINKKISHLVLGKQPEGAYEEAEKYGCALLTERLLVDFLNSKENPYLLEKGTGEEQNIQNIRQLLISGQNDSLELAFELMKGGGFPESLLTEMFLIYKDKSSYSSPIYRQAQRFLEQHGSAELRSKLKRRLQLTGRWVNENTIRKNIEYYCEETKLNASRIVHYLYNKYQKGLIYVLDCFEEKEKLEFLQELIVKNKGTLALKSYGISSLSEDIAKLKGLKVLDISYNMFTSLPPVVLKLKDLEELYFYSYYHYGIKSFPKALLSMPKLRKIYFNRRVADLPSKEAQAAANCEIIIK